MVISLFYNIYDVFTIFEGSYTIIVCCLASRLNVPFPLVTGESKVGEYGTTPGFRKKIVLELRSTWHMASCLVFSLYFDEY